ncbi:hypothetical protein D7T48_18495 [Stenotrophomonas maltophilia]|nr:hypothetical protein C6Y55_22460 [Stenotrophomonas maltophilia]MBA0279140.1 hypothetical protein [Stenotrophomonas maltophilia]MBA0414165.1 hypothetical protein [Stenotrophomonas maltophilia]MBA0499406.1 hypothetical protein [Stenotrophomonas maltophilia]MBA0504052.1 hypothetical protein [Stenotrophomonas maltophilia]
MEIECLEVDQGEVAIETRATDGADELLAVILAWMAESEGLDCQTWIVSDYDIPDSALLDNRDTGLCDF